MPAEAAPAPRTRRRFLRTGARLVAGLALLVTVGAVVLLLPGIATRPLAVNEAVFTATSALTVTGLSLITPARDLTLAGQSALLVMLEIGGVGFMTGAVVILRLLGRKIYLSDRLALRDSLGLVEPRAILRVMRTVVLTTLAIQLAGAVLLWFNWHEELGAATAAFYALFHAVSAFCNAGFDLFGGSPYFGGSMPADGGSLSVLAALIVLGGLGIPVLADLLAWPRHRRHRLSLHTRITLSVYAILIVGGALGFLAAETLRGGALSGMPLGRSLTLATFQSIAARTAGMVALPGLEALTPASQWLMIALMLIGCAPASMGGGITTGTFVVLTLSLWAYARGHQAAKVGGRTIGTEALRRAGAVLTVSLLVVGVATWLILITHAAAIDVVLFEVVSAFATTGITLAFTLQLNLFGQAIIMLVMFWGRLGALTIFVVLAQPKPPEAISYPEETLLIG